MVSPYLPIVLIGTLRRDFIIAPGGKALNDIPGGHLFYTATGLYHWENQIGLVSRVGRSYPQEWLDQLKAYRMDVRGVKLTGLPVEHRFFIRYDDTGQKSTLNPLAHYANEKMPFPKALLGYVNQSQKFDSLTVRGEETIVARDIPADYLEAPFVHLCPMDYLTHNLLTQHFAQFGQKRITLKAGRGYMAPQFWKLIPEMVHGLTAFITSESCLRSLFAEQRAGDLWQMAATIADWGVENVIIQPSDRSTLLYDGVNHSRYTLPPYPTQVVNLTGVNDAFCGGFIGSLIKSYQPVRALIAGNAAASFAVEGNQPYYAMDVVPGLHEARMEYLESLLTTC